MSKSVRAVLVLSMSGLLTAAEPRPGDAGIAPLLAGEMAASYDDERRLWGRIEESTRARYGSGLAEQGDVLRAQAEAARLVPMRRHEEGNAAKAVAALNALLGRPAGTPLPTHR